MNYIKNYLNSLKQNNAMSYFLTIISDLQYTLSLLELIFKYKQFTDINNTYTIT